MFGLTSAVQNCKMLWSAEYEQEVIDIIKNWCTGKKKPRSHYHIRNTFALKELAGVTKVMYKKDERILATKETVISIIRDIHTAHGHKGERKTHKKICVNYSNISRNIVAKFIRQCERCVEKARRKETGSGVVVKPIKVTNLNDRAQIDLVDFQSLPDGKFKYILHYQEHLTKFHILRPLTSKRAAEVAYHLLQIMIDFGAVHVLQSDNGREFTAKVIEVL